MCTVLHVLLPNSKEPLKECHQLSNDTLLLFGTVATTETGHRRHQLIDVSASGLNRTITEGHLNKLAGFLFLQIFFLDQLHQLALLLLRNILPPFDHNIGYIVNTGNEVLNQSLLATELRAASMAF